MPTESTEPPIAALEAVSREYDDGRVVALRDVTLSVARGEWLSVVGPSGSGKSTLLHLLGGLDRPTQGTARFEGRAHRGTRAWARLRAQRIGFVFQAFNLLPTLSAQENVEIPMFGVLGRAAARRRRAVELLDRVGLSDRMGHRPGQLSGGERQRVAIARALANAPDLILADEPTGNLDSKNSEEIIDLLGDIHTHDGATLVVITHERTIAARADRTLRFADGAIVPDAE